MRSKLILLTVLFSSLAGINAFSQTTVAPKITAMRAKIFYDVTGTFSEDILVDNKDVVLWNTIGGETPSTSTFVTVEISGKNLPAGITKIEITATGDKRRLIQKKLMPIELYDQRTTFFAPLWLYDTDCEPITISARLIGKGASAASVTKKIPFRCGE